MLVGWPPTSANPKGGLEPLAISEMEAEDSVRDLLRQVPSLPDEGGSRRRFASAKLWRARGEG